MWRWTTRWIGGKRWTWVCWRWSGESGVKKCCRSGLRSDSSGLRSRFFFFFLFFFFFFFLWPMPKGGGLGSSGLWSKFFFFSLLWLMAKGRCGYGFDMDGGWILSLLFLSLWVWLNWQWRKKKSRLFSSCRRVLVGGCFGFGLVVDGWEREKQRDGDHRWREKTERFFILFYCVIYIILICRMKK